MTINIADNNPRVQYSVAEGATQSTFSVPFEFFDNEDLTVYVDNVQKVLDFHYTVTGGDGSTGTITMSVTGATGGSTVTITRDVTLERITDFPVSGAFNIVSLNTELDRFTAIAADLNDRISRSLLLKDYDENINESTFTLPLFDDRRGRILAFDGVFGNPVAGPLLDDANNLIDRVNDIARLADIEDGTLATNAIQNLATVYTDIPVAAYYANQINTVSTRINDVSNVAANLSVLNTITLNLNDIVAAGQNITDIISVNTNISSVGTVAANIASVNTVAANIASVISVANDLTEAISEVETVANDLNEAVSEIDTVANNIANVNIVGTNISNVNSVGPSISNVNTVAANIIDVNTVATNIGNLTTLSNINSDVSVVAGIATNVTTVAGISSDVTTVSSNNLNITTVAGISGNITTVAGISANVTTVAGSISSVNTVSTNVSNVNTTAANIANINTVANAINDVSTVSSDIAAVITAANDLNEAVSEIETVAASITNVDSVGNAIGNVNNVSANIADVNTVATNITDVSTVAAKVGVGQDITVVASSISDVTTVSGSISNVNIAAGNTTNINTVAANIVNVNAVAGSISDVNTVAFISSDVTTVAADGADIGAVATDIANVNTVAGSILNVNTTATNISDVTTVAGEIGVTGDVTIVAGQLGAGGAVTNVSAAINNVITVSQNLANVNNFAEVYRISANAPTTSLDTGDLWYDTLNTALKVYDGSQWTQGVLSGSGFLPLTGGTMSGDISMAGNDIYTNNGSLQMGTGIIYGNTFSGNATTATKLQALSTNPTSDSVVFWDVSAGNYAYLDFASLDAGTLNGLNSTQFLRSDANDTLNAVINGSDSLPLVQVTAGKAYFGSTGRSTMNLAVSSSTGVKANVGGTEYTMWHAGNDGSGSGLDADTVDGIQASSFLRSDADDSASGDITFTESIQIQSGGGSGNPIRIGSGFGTGGSATIHRLNGDLYLQYANGQASTNVYLGGGGTTANINMQNGSISYIGNIYNNGWFRNNYSGVGLYNEVTTQHFYSDDDDWWNIAGGTGANGLRFRDEHAGTIRGSVYANAENSIGFLDAGGNWAIQHVNDAGTYFYTDNNTEEFKVGRDTVTGDYGTVQTSTTKNYWGGYSINGQYVFMSDHASAVGIYNDIDNEWMLYAARNGGVSLYYDGSGKLDTTSSGVTVNGGISINDANTQINEGATDSVRVQTNYGYVDVGPQNSSWSHFQTDRPSFYFNKYIRAEGSIGVYGGTAYMDATYVYGDGSNLTNLPAGAPSITGTVSVGTSSLEIEQTGGTNYYRKFYRSGFTSAVPWLSERYWQAGAISSNAYGIKAVSMNNAYGTDLMIFNYSFQGYTFGVGVTAPSYTTSSDINLKENIVGITDAITKVQSLNGYYYNLIGKDETKIGVIAQEVEVNLPELVKTQLKNQEDFGVEGAETFKTVEYQGLIPVLIEAIKEQQSTITALEARITALEG